MIPVKGTGSIINVQCTEIALPEFPELLFGTHVDNSRFFDATHYLSIKDPNHKLSVEDFFKKIDFQINAIAKTYQISEKELAIINTVGHQLINGCLCYPFLSYVDPQFCVYINEIIDELFTVGIVVSDTHLLTLVKKRLTPELLKQIWNDGEEMA